MERSFNGHGTACRPPWRRLPFAVLAALLATGCVSERDGPNAREQQAANNPSALLRIAKVAERNGDLSGAAEFYNRAFELRPDAGDAVIGLARTRAGLGRADEALPALRDAHLRAPADHRLTALLGQLEVQAHQPGQALATFQDGLRQVPADAELLTGQGIALDALGRHGEAQVSYHQVLAQDPGSIAARNNFALSLALSSQPVEAAALLRDLAPDVTARGSSAQVATVRGNLALAHGLSGDERRAEQALGASLSDADRADNLRAYARLRSGLTPEGQGGLPAGPGPAAAAPVGAPGPDGAAPPAVPGTKAGAPS